MKKGNFKLLKDALYSQYRKTKIYHTADYKSFRKSKESRFVILNAPAYANIGDQAILKAELKFLKDKFPGNKVLALSQYEHKLMKRDLSERINNDDIIFITGGGFIGTLWPGHQTFFNEVLETYYNKKIVILPQTVYFEPGNHGYKELKKMNKLLKKCKDITFFVRDKSSYDFVIKKTPLTFKNCFLVPDFVTYLEYPAKYSDRHNEVLFCMRSDKEKSNDVDFSSIKKQLDEMNYTYSQTDTVLNRDYLSPWERESSVDDKVKEFSSARLVITDRLHGMLLATISSTPCIALNNVSGKVKGQYEWLKNIPYIHFIEPDELDFQYVQNMLNLDSASYSNEQFKEYYTQIYDIINSKIKK